MEERFFNRELSWIEFNGRVLYQALRKENPLLERLQFLSIVTSNFDEFFQVRVASVKRMQMTNPEQIDCSGLTSELVLRQISSRCHEIIRKQHECLANDILPELAQKNIVYVKPQDFTSVQNEFALSFFMAEVFPLLTPLRTDTEVFPHIINQARYVAFMLKPIKGIHNANALLKGDDSAPRISLVQVPTAIPQLVWLPGEKGVKKFALLEEIVSHYGTQLFPGFAVEETMIFKVLRDADFAVDEESGRNFIHEMEKVLDQRKTSFAVQLMCDNSSQKILRFLMGKLELGEDDTYCVDGIIDPKVLGSLRDLDETGEMQFPKWNHFYPAGLSKDEPFWDILKQRDILLHVPYQSYEPVIKFISDAADDPDVLAIKMTLYRTGEDSRIVNSLMRAAQSGKQVVVLVELKARFDEERNIAWAQKLENAGVTVIYGLVNLKVHAKMIMVMRRENETICRYAHLSTGNYNPKTAEFYSDLSLFTSNLDMVSDATQFFNLVTGYSTLQSMKRFGMAPVNLKSMLVAMINREIERSSPEHPGLIMAKMNSLTHEEVIPLLYKASQAGVKVLLNVRGICMLVPGVKGMSENIKVVSIVDRYLEHSRVFYFQNGGSEEIYLSSADWMSRNLDRRIEVMFPVLDRKAFDEVKEVLEVYFKDNTNALELTENGDWVPVKAGTSEKEKVRAQEVLYKKYKKRDSSSSEAPKIEFVVRRKD
ncbi:MAG: polyphosphate kinase 1 [Treponema sp.]|nr:polyphosphate kinase 1 [Treponema sp.]